MQSFLKQIKSVTWSLGSSLTCFLSSFSSSHCRCPRERTGQDSLYNKQRNRRRSHSSGKSPHLPTCHPSAGARTQGCIQQLLIHRLVPRWKWINLLPLPPPGSEWILTHPYLWWRSLLHIAHSGNVPRLPPGKPSTTLVILIHHHFSTWWPSAPTPAPGWREREREREREMKHKRERERKGLWRGRRFVTRVHLSGGDLLPAQLAEKRLYILP